tara:strand:+ start:35058 stop:35255 length:198 start_codon:yes stop_codon:yes gene_type:complete
MSVFIAIKMLILIVLVSGWIECYRNIDDIYSLGIVESFVIGCVKCIGLMIIISILFAAIMFIVLA